MCRKYAFIFVKLTKLAALNLTKLGMWESGSVVKRIVKVLDRLKGNIDIVSYRENFKGTNP